MYVARREEARKMDHPLILVLLASVTSLTSSQENGNIEGTTLQVLAVVPVFQENNSIPMPNWNKGQQILLGAELATMEINNRSDILPNSTLEIITVERNLCEGYDGLIHIINSTLNPDNKIVSIIGILCPKEVRILLSLASRLIQLSGSASVEVVNDPLSPDLVHLLQPFSDEVIKTAFLLVEQFNRSRLSIVTDTADCFDFNTDAELSHIKIVRVNGAKSIDDIASSLNFEVNLISMSIPNTFELLCKVYSRNNISWGNYAWIVINYQVEEFISYAAILKETKCSTEYLKLLEGTIFIYQQLDYGSQIMSEIELMPLQYNNTNPFAYIFYNAIWDIGLALNKSMYMYDDDEMYRGNESRLTDLLNMEDFDVGDQVSLSSRLREMTKVVIYQMHNGVEKYLGYLDKNSLQLVVNDTISAHEKVDSNDQDQSSPLYIILYIDTTACFIFITAVFILYCRYRKQDSIKSTSLSLSMMIFAGCYLIVLYLAVNDLYYLPQQYQSFSHNFQIFECLVRIWMHALGVPSILILATLIVKIGRIYYIFLSPAKLRFSSNAALLYML